MIYTVSQAKNNLSRLLREVEAGQEVIVTRGGKPVAKLVPVADTTAKIKYRRLGGFEGLIQVDDSALDPLTDEEMIEYGFDNPEKDARLRAAMETCVDSTGSTKSTEWTPRDHPAHLGLNLKLSDNRETGPCKQAR